MSMPAPHWTTRAYPTAYRREYAAEVSDLLSQVTADRGRLAGVLEQAAVLGHALRLRTGMDSARPGGRFLAGLLPLAVPVAASLCLTLLVVQQLPSLPWDGERAYTPLAYVPWLAVLGCALAGRWAAARIAAGAALLGAAASLPLVRWTDGAEGLAQNQATLAGLALAALLVLAAPPDLPPTSGGARRTMVLIALALGVPLLAGSVTVFQVATGPYATADARPDPLRLLFFFTPLVLAVPAALAIARARFGPALAALLIAGSVLAFVPVGQLGEVPYGTGNLWARMTGATGVLALLVYAALRTRERRHAMATR
ncbi:hypothetical protein E0500_009905 [Streptomyces sp. KM273126]|uniref:hypothetical protein n=1 Tax=Streptomyces sp. KM273126 TaxID=2545247 RepID=UPI00103E61B7|nr:hypothetical protein [Streptomyces sp. KM273126]MBA2807719.1 hypothetical protein [Streptomyces sp. KM273126]